MYIYYGKNNNNNYLEQAYLINTKLSSCYDKLNCKNINKYIYIQEKNMIIFFFGRRYGINTMGKLLCAQRMSACRYIYTHIFFCFVSQF